MALTSPRFRWNTRLQAVEKSSPLMKRGEKGLAVRLIQRAMIDWPISPMTNTIKKHGTVDGIFGGETVDAIKKYQRIKGLSVDGIVGQNTMRALDADLPGGAPTLPPLPGDGSKPGYTVPGAITIFDQVAGGNLNGCWAYSYTMLLAWKNRESLTPDQAMADVGNPWLALYTAQGPLPWVSTARFFRDVGLSVEEMQSYPMAEWANLLRAHGPLIVDAASRSLSGGHVRILHGVTGDGTPRGTLMSIVDPWNGRSYKESYEKFLAIYEAGGAQPGRTAHLAHW